MRVRTISIFWSHGGILTSPIWALRDAEWEAAEAAVHQAEALDLHAWLRLNDAQRGAVMDAYAVRRRPAGELVAA